MYGPGGRAASRRVGGRLAARLRGLGAGADRQRRVGPVPAGRLRRGACRPCTRRARWAAPLSDVGLGPAEGAGRVRRDSWKEPDDGHLGGARPAPALHPLQGHGLGGRRPGRARPSRSSASTAPSTSGATLRDEIHDEVCDKGYNAEVGRLHPVLRLRRARRQPAHDPAGGLPARHRRAGALHRRGHRARADRGRLRAALPGHRRPAPSTGSAGTRAPSWPARSGWPTACT